MALSGNTTRPVRIRHWVHTILPPSPVILWIKLGGKPKWLPLNSEYHDVMCTSPIVSMFLSLSMVNTVTLQVLNLSPKTVTCVLLCFCVLLVFSFTSWKYRFLVVSDGRISAVVKEISCLFWVSRVLGFFSFKLWGCTMWEGRNDQHSWRRKCFCVVQLQAPLHCAAREGHIVICRRLTAARAITDIRDAVSHHKSAQKHKSGRSCLSKLGPKETKALNIATVWNYVLSSSI